MGIILDGQAMLKQITEEPPSATDISMAKYTRNRLLLVERAKWGWYDRTIFAILAAFIGFVTWLIIAMVGVKYWGG